MAYFIIFSEEAMSSNNKGEAEVNFYCPGVNKTSTIPSIPGKPPQVEHQFVFASPV